MVLTVQILRDKLKMHGPSTYWDIERILGITELRDAVAMTNVVHEAVEKEILKENVITIEYQKYVVYTV